MKKKILLIVVASFMLMGVVSAASLWGTYKAKQIIRLTVDGVPVKVSDAPAVMMDGRTMVPIYLLKEAGVNYSWDSSNQTVNISKTQMGSSAQSDLIILAEISNHYNRLEELGDILWEAGDRLLDAKASIDLGYGFKESVESAANSIKIASPAYDSITEDNQYIINRARSINIDISNTNDLLDNYYSAMEFYIESITGLGEYTEDRSNKSYNKFMDNLKSGDDLIDQGKRTSSDDYQHYINKLINSK